MFTKIRNVKIQANESDRFHSTLKVFILYTFHLLKHLVFDLYQTKRWKSILIEIESMFMFEIPPQMTGIIRRFCLDKFLETE